jgi:crossover junction endodeoxyribonuclease RuvC
VRLLGIDPAIGCTGYGVIDAVKSGPRVVEAGTIDTAPALPLATRLAEIHEQIEAILAEHKPDRMAIEALYAHYRHPRTAIIMGHARGVVMLAAARRGLEVLDLPATQVKRCLTGNGRASKQQVQRAVQVALGLNRLLGPLDVSDALAVALTALQESEQPRRLAAGATR